jgi:DNA helicase IV
VVVEPTQIVNELVQGMRSLYVALTRSTQRLTIVHSTPLPAPLR